MAGYQPLKIAGNSTGLVQNREEFLLPDDAYPTLINAYVWRERIKRKQGWLKLGRLRRMLINVSLTPLSADPFSFNLYTDIITPITKEPNAQIETKSVFVWVNPTTTTGAITGYTIDTNCDVTAVGHGRATGDVVTISGVTIVDGSGDNEINSGSYTITVVDVDHFQLNVSSATWGTYLAGGTWSVITGWTDKLIDQGDGTLATSPVSGITGTVNYLTGAVVITGAAAGLPTKVSFNYFPGLPVMGIRTREDEALNIEQTVFFDTKYAYEYNSGFEEFLPGTTWTGSDSDFFWTTNYWISKTNNKVFWETNDTTDPIRYTDGQVGTNWINFSPTINVAGEKLNTCKCMLPFRGRMVVFNTVENNLQFPNRIRWAAIGNPFSDVSAIVTVVNVNAWRDDIRGQGGFLDIPTSEDIITVGFVRDNLVIYCERSTWQLRYTGRSIAPFQIEKVNSELGVESTFSGVQFDTSLVGIGDKGIVECDSYQSKRIDVKIPDLVQALIQNQNNGAKRVHGIRDFQNKLAYWIYPAVENRGTYPDKRLCYNYENDSWGIFTDSLTALGTYQNQTGLRWSDFVEGKEGKTMWEQANFNWITQQADFPNIMGGNQQGYVLYLNQVASNAESLFISAITGHTTTSTVITSPSHNMQNKAVIKIVNVPSTSSFFTNLNNKIFSIRVLTPDTFSLWKYNTVNGQFDVPQLDAPGTYTGEAEIQVRDNFNIVSKRFNHMDEGKQYQLGYIDILTNTTAEGAMTLNVYNDYDDPMFSNPSNQLPENSSDDTFFNQTIETTTLQYGVNGGQKQWRRVFCPTNSNFITLEYTLSNAQMIGPEQESDLQIDAQIVWSRIGGRLGITS